MKHKIILIATLLFVAITNTSAQVVSNNEIAARKWIKEKSNEFKIEPYHDFKLSYVRKGETGETLRFQQMLQEVPVFQSEFVLHFSKENIVVFSSNSYDSTIQNIPTNPSISMDVALIKSKDILAIVGEYEVAENNLFVMKVNDQTKLVYRVITNPANGVGSWEVLVDAQSGTVLSTKDVAIYHHKIEPKKSFQKKIDKNNNMLGLPIFVPGTAMVYLSDPLSFAHVDYGAAGYVDGNDANTSQLASARTAVILPEIDLTSGIYKLKSSYAEIKDFEAPFTGLFTQATSDFSFTRDNNAFEAVNVFYQLDKSMRYINQTLGVVCLPQLNSGIVHFDPSGLSGADNSHYIPSADRLAFGEGCVDDAEDADVIWHELGHGLHDWLTNGNASGLIGEGNGDYWAQSYSRSLNQWTPNDPAYHFMFSWDGNNPCWDGRTTNYAATYPNGLVGGSGHTDGQIWATCLMKIWDQIGREKTDIAFLEGLALTNSSTNQQDAAIAVRQAGINRNFSCADIQAMTDNFTSTGYTMPSLPLTMASIANQTVQAGAGDLYTLPSYAALANPISPSCSAILSQSPAVGTNLPVGVHPITMTATFGLATVTRTFTLTVTSNLSVPQNMKEGIMIYPNPTGNQLIIKGEFDANESFAIYNLLGQKVIERNFISKEEKVDVSQLESGVYSVFFNYLKSTYKFVKK